MNAWNGWYHVNGNTYGTWLRGDPRGWRARWHRRHVEGDSRKPPPPGTFDTLHQQSKRLLKAQPVRLDAPQQVAGGQAFVEKLIKLGVEVLSFALDATHYHLLARFPDGEVRQRVGKAKKNASPCTSGGGSEASGKRVSIHRESSQGSCVGLDVSGGFVLVEQIGLNPLRGRKAHGLLSVGFTDFLHGHSIRTFGA